MRILICGSRDWTNEKAILREMHLFPRPGVIIHGGARGADTIAGKLATQFGFEIIVFPADWKKHGKAAGPIRNQQMLDEGKPDYVYAFTKDLAKSRGTKDMVTRARKAGVEVRIFGK